MAEEAVLCVQNDLPWYANCSLEDVRCFIGANLRTVARSVVAVGYYLKQARDRELWKDAEEGYTSVWDFASREYGISKSTASRYMSINDRFSEGGDSPIVQVQYREMSKSQLQEMLYLTDSQIEHVTPENTVQEIRAMRIPEPQYVEPITGQMSIEDFGLVPDPGEDAAATWQHAAAEEQRPGACVVTFDDIMPPPEEPDECCDVATVDYDTEEDEEEADPVLYEYVQKVRKLLRHKKDLMDRNVRIFGVGSFDELDDENRAVLENDQIVIRALTWYADVLEGGRE